MNSVLETDGYTIPLPEGVSADDCTLTGGSMEFRLVQIPGTPFCKLVPIDGTFKPFAPVP